MSPIFVRTAAVGDLPAIRDLLGETWHDTYDAIYGAACVAEITASWHSIATLQWPDRSPLPRVDKRRGRGHKSPKPSDWTR